MRWVEGKKRMAWTKITAVMVLASASFLTASLAHAQTMTEGERIISTGGSIPLAGVYGVVPTYGGVIPAGNGYDPMESARQVTSGSQTMMDASMANTRNAERALNGDGDSSSGTTSDSDTSTAEAKAAKAKTQAENAANASMGSDLAGEPSKSIMDDGKSSETSSVDKDAAKAAADDSSYKSILTDEDKAKAAEVKAALVHADSYVNRARGNGTATDQTKKAATPQKTSQAIFSGYAHALDSITLSVSGKTVVLDHLRGPGSQEVCFRDALPWSCGEDGRDVTERAVSGLWMACRLTSGNRGQCYTESGENVADVLLRRGYASRT